MIAEIADGAGPKAEPVEIEMIDRPLVRAVIIDGETLILNRLFNMAETYFANKAIHQAIEMFFELVEKHDDTPQARLAFNRLLAICEWFELRGELHQARSLYERLL